MEEYNDELLELEDIEDKLDEDWIEDWEAGFLIGLNDLEE